MRPRTWTDMAGGLGRSIGPARGHGAAGLVEGENGRMVLRPVLPKREDPPAV